MGLIQEAISIGKKESAKPVQDKNGLWYYSEQPEGTRLATMNDISAGVFKPKTPFLVHSYYSEKFECYRSSGRISELLIEFIKGDRVYCLKANEELKPVFFMGFSGS